MAGIGLLWNAEKLGADAVLKNGDLDELDELNTAVIISLFSWRRANADDVLPDETADPQGFWGDMFATHQGDRLGSRLWLLSREKLTQETLNRAKEYAQEALQWLIEDAVASRVVVDVERKGLDQLALLVTVYRSAGNVAVLRFDQVWEGLRNAA